MLIYIRLLCVHLIYTVRQDLWGESFQQSSDALNSAH